MAKALVFLATGFEEIETLTVVDILRRAGVDVTVAGLTPNVTEGKHGVKVVPDKSIDDVKVEDFDAVVVPGGNPGYKNLRKDPRVIAMVKKAFNSNKIVAAICAGPTVLSDAGILEGKACTIYPGMDEELEAGRGKPKHDIVVVDGNIITSRGPATALPFALKLAEKLAGKQVAEAVSKKTLANISRW
ncbi:MAG: DJ-1/PfpI family protein [Candidatus Bathyarchaeota archaeon]|jgi:4-methyl-5(b-hydroxyethyl)-thiazole monophosphate biosynthesis